MLPYDPLGVHPNFLSLNFVGPKKSGTKKEHKPKLLSPDIFRWGRGLPREGVGAKKFGMSLETREIKLFGRDIPEFCRDIPAVPEKFEKKKFVFNFWPLKNPANFPPKFACGKVEKITDELLQERRERQVGAHGSPPPN